MLSDSELRVSFLCMCDCWASSSMAVSDRLFQFFNTLVAANQTTWIHDGRGTRCGKQHTHQFSYWDAGGCVGLQYLQKLAEVAGFTVMTGLISHQISGLIGVKNAEKLSCRRLTVALGHSINKWDYRMWHKVMHSSINHPPSIHPSIYI